MFPKFDNEPLRDGGGALDVAVVVELDETAVVVLWVAALVEAAELVEVTDIVAVVLSVTVMVVVAGTFMAALLPN